MSVGGEAATNPGGLGPVAPHGFKTADTSEQGGDIICLSLAPDALEDLGDDRADERGAVVVEQSIDSSLSADCGRLKKCTQMPVSMRTSAIRLGGLEYAPVVVHVDLAGKLFQAHPARVAAKLVESRTHRTLDIVLMGEITEILEFVVGEMNCGGHAAFSTQSVSVDMERE